MSEPPPADDLASSLEAARVGPAGRLDLHPLRPSPEQAVRRVRDWLAERQVQGLAEALVITGRGAHSADGDAPVRTAVARLLRQLRLEGVLTGVSESGPGGFAVTLAPLAARLDAIPRRRATPPPTGVRRAVLEGLDADVLALLEDVAARRLDHLGLRAPTAAQVADEMSRVFSRLAAREPDRLREALVAERDRLLHEG